MGTNEHAVAIGNEAVHAIVPAQRRRALTGMDLVRLGLERAASAAEAVSVITGLLETHGQGGDCGHLGRFYYHNSFLIADPAEAFVLETVGREWALEPVARTRSISNALSIDGFADRLMDRDRDKVTRGTERCVRAASLMAARDGDLTVADMMALLRDHGPAAETDPDWTPAKLNGRTICMHAGPGDRRSQTVGSLVSELRPECSVHWVTGSSAPCLSLFKPVLLETGLPDQGPIATDRCDPGAPWWAHERLHRRVLVDYASRAAALRGERDRLEADFRERIDTAVALDADPGALTATVDSCWREAADVEARWLAALQGAPSPGGGASAYRRSWRRLDQAAGAR
jgi:dipeptidase